ncbi:MAG TPA: hypothetical protein VEB70_05240 [Noviherbaspirillum sp.]|nr:hypothetical protein [Noviherbaspirillum sp.]
MRRLVISAAVAASVAACMITPEGARISAPPPAIQGSNDAQGSPISVPGAGMGVGAGNPAAPGPSGTGPELSR